MNNYVVGINSHLVFSILRIVLISLLIFPIFRPLKGVIPEVDKIGTAFITIVSVSIVLYHLVREFFYYRTPRYLLMFIAVIVITYISYFKANITFGQSLSEFFLTKTFIKYISGLTPIALYIMIEHGIVRRKDLIRSLIGNTFLYMAIFLYFVFVGIESPTEEVSFVRLELEKSENPYYFFNIDIMLIALCYCIVKLVRRSFLYFAPVVAILVFYVSVFRQRTLTLVMGLMSFYTMFKSMKLERMSSIIVVALCFSPLVVILGYFFLEQHLNEFINTFTKLFGFLFDASDGPTTNVSLRFVQIERAKKYLLDNIFLGVGYLGGEESFIKEFGGYFYPEDIGLVGNILVHGILGYLVYLYFIIAPFFTQNNRATNSDDLVLAIRCYSISILIKMIYSMINVSLPGVYFLPYVLLCLKPSLLFDKKTT